MPTNPVVEMSASPMEEEGVIEIPAAEVVQLFPSLVSSIDEMKTRLATVRKAATSEKRADLLINDYLPFQAKLLRRFVTVLAGATSASEEALAVATGEESLIVGRDADRLLDVVEATFAVLGEALEVAGVTPELRKRIEAARLDLQYVGGFVEGHSSTDDDDEDDEGVDEDGDEGDDAPDAGGGNAPALATDA